MKKTKTIIIIIAMLLIAALGFWGWHSFFTRQGTTPNNSLKIVSQPANSTSPAVQPLTNPEPPANPNQKIQVPILMYHYIRVNPDPNDKIGAGLSVTPDNFNAQLDYLKNHSYQTITLDDLILALAGTKQLPARPIILTFDDGYADFYSTAFPALKQRQMQATAYIITGFVGKSDYLTWNQIKELDKSGLITIGAHTVNHVDLPKVTSKIAQDEIENSKQTLAKQLGHAINHFCYPSGKYNDATITLVKNAGYLSATTVAGGTTHSYNDRYQLTRVRINGSTSLQSFATLVAK